MSKTIAEIHAQYDALKQTLEMMEKRRDDAQRFFREANADSIVAIGCGSSFQLSESIALTARLRTGVSSVALAGGDVLLDCEQYAPLFTGNPMIITVSRSGSTSEVLFALRKLKAVYPKLKVVCIACTNGSAIAAESDYVIELPWAFDESVCQTRSVTNLYAAAMLFLAAAADCSSIFDSYKKLTEGGDGFVEKYEATLKAIGTTDFTSAAVLCDGEAVGVASEAALAFNEIAYTPSVFKRVLDVRHGPIVLFNSKTLAILRLSKQGFDYELALIGDILKRGAKVVVVSDEELPPIDGVCAQLHFGVPLDGAAVGAILLPVAQLISYYHSLAVGSDPDHPDGLDAWIKL